MARAVWNGTVIAESETTVEVEGNQYFPPGALRREHLQPSKTTSHCGWKGDANYYDVIVDGQVNADAAWSYAAPLDAAANIKDHVAFWKGVQVEA